MFITLELLPRGLQKKKDVSKQDSLLNSIDDI